MEKKEIDLIEISLNLCFVRDFITQEDKTKKYLQIIIEEISKKIPKSLCQKKRKQTKSK